ncbi:MAG: ATP-binding cassette domain-containing protein, partial [Phascolarctobacterium sp.]|nr:ATP-binding cassette domain-containing protein [Phascolarctobacterium sp.]
MINAVEIRNLIKKFGDITALDGLSLNIEKGKITGLIGADGAGKTTLSRTIIGLLVPDAGEISVLGFNPATQKNDLIVHIGYMPQKFGLYEDLSVLENLILYADLKDVPHDFDKMLEFTSLTTFQNRLAGDLSGGMKQKLGLACTLLGNPAFLVLDEPSVGVDPISRRDLMRMVREMMGSETTVLWSTAYLDEAHSFDTSVVIDKGKIIYDGIPSALGATAQEFQDKVIELMGGYKEEESQIAKNYRYRAAEVDLTVEADNLAKRYGDFYAVKNNTLKIKKGEIFGLIGPNGAGKSTSFKMMCGLARPTEGTARIMGIDIRTDPERARSNLGYMAQKFSLYGTLTVEENLEFFGAAYGIGILDRGRRIDDIMEIFNLKEYADQKSEDLPLGLKQRLSMACALIHNPPILFLDEPTSGVDVRMRRGFWNHITSLAKKGVTVMVTTHFMDE